MSDDSRSFDPVQTLAKHAEHLNAICSPGPRPKVSYEIMSGALIWSDETNSKTPGTVMEALRYVVAYRTSLMLGKPREVLKPIWEHALTLFPNWVGFRPERRQPTPAPIVAREAEVAQHTDAARCHHVPVTKPPNHQTPHTLYQPALLPHIPLRRHQQHKHSE